MKESEQTTKSDLLASNDLFLDRKLHVTLVIENGVSQESGESNEFGARHFDNPLTNEEMENMENRLVRTSCGEETCYENSGRDFRVHLRGVDNVRAFTVRGTNVLFDYGSGSNQYQRI
jgi:hypothetical protein